MKKSDLSRVFNGFNVCEFVNYIGHEIRVNFDNDHLFIVLMIHFLYVFLTLRMTMISFFLERVNDEFLVVSIYIYIYLNKKKRDFSNKMLESNMKIKMVIVNKKDEKKPYKIVKVQKTPNIMKTSVLCNLVMVKVFVDGCNGFKALGFLSRLS